MKLKYVVLVLPLLSGAVAYTCHANATALSQLWRKWTASGPIVIVPRLIELGEREIGEVVLCQVPMTNKGASPLIIDNVVSNCACAGLERILNGEMVRVDSVRLAPGERVELVMRVSVRGQPGRRMLNGISFGTNDPRNPTVTLETNVSKVRAGVNIVPTCITLGRILRGSKVSHRLTLWDDSPDMDTIEEVTVPHPSGIMARVLSSRGPNAEVAGVGRQLGALEVEVNTDRVRKIDDEILVKMRDRSRPAARIRVLGQVVPVIEVTPRSIQLPLASRSGLVYSIDCRCRHNGKLPFQLQPISVPSGVSVAVSDWKERSDIKVVRVSWRERQSSYSGDRKRVTVKFRATVDGINSDVEVPVEIGSLPDSKKE